MEDLGVRTHAFSFGSKHLGPLNHLLTHPALPLGKREMLLPETELAGRMGNEWVLLPGKRGETAFSLSSEVTCKCPLREHPFSGDTENWEMQGVGDMEANH